MMDAREDSMFVIVGSKGGRRGAQKISIPDIERLLCVSRAQTSYMSSFCLLLFRGHQESPRFALVAHPHDD